MNLPELASLTTNALRGGQEELLFDMETEIFQAIAEYPLWQPRFHAWYAQAYLNRKQPKIALRHCNTGIRLAKAIQDEEGRNQIKELRDQCTAMLVALDQQAKQGGSLLEQALQEIASQNWETAKQLTQTALNEAIEKHDNKQEILALLAMVEIPSESEWAIDEAYRRCQEIGDKNLITAVKKSMDSIGKEVPSHVF